MKGKSKPGGACKSLQQRIMNSHCRLCGQRGRWRAECPLRQQGATSTPAATANEATTPAGAFTGLVEIAEMEGGDYLPMEFLNLREEPAIDDASRSTQISFGFVRLPVSRGVETARDRTRAYLVGKDSKHEPMMQPVPVWEAGPRPSAESQMPVREMPRSPGQHPSAR